jgi:hypothetical protein
MNKEEIQEGILQTGEWYQRVNLDGIWTTDNMLTGEHIWPHIRECLPDNLNGMTAMDIGANACYYSFMLALEGVNVIAVEPSTLYYNQALFLRKYFEEKHQKELPVTILKKSISDIDLSEHKFDFVLALSILYFIGRQFGEKYSDPALEEMKRIVKELTQVTDRVLVRTRNKVYYSSVKYYTSIFEEFGFSLLKRINMKRPITLYGR